MANKKVKKMTCKEFKQAFNECGYDFEIWGWDGILNMLACYATREEEYQLSIGNDVLAGVETERRHKIHDYLDARGYFD